MPTPSILTSLAQLISSSVETIERICEQQNIAFPDINAPYTPESEPARVDTEMAGAVACIVAASKHLSAIVHPAPLGLVTTAMQFHVCSAIRFAERTHTAEVLHNWPKGLHVKEISAVNGANPGKLARILRLLATQHIFREVEPDVFANNRISSILDTGKTYKELMAHPEDKFENTSGVASTISWCVDECFKSSAQMTESLFDDGMKYSESPTKTAFNRALNVMDLGLFDWFALPENDFRRRRFGMAMEGVSQMFPYKPVSEGTEWDVFRALPVESIVVDVGGGIGSVSLALAREFPQLKFVIQDQETVIKDASTFWKSKFPEALVTDRVKFQVHNFFDPQPIKAAQIYMMRMIIHDWGDSYCVHILKHLRDAAGTDTQLIIIDTIISYACNDAESKQIPGAAGPAAPDPLLPNWGNAKLFDFVHDCQMNIMLNGEERTLSGFIKLLSKSGWKVIRVDGTGLSAPQQHIIAVPI